jgi:hypothetical protein
MGDKLIPPLSRAPFVSDLHYSPSSPQPRPYLFRMTYKLAVASFLRTLFSSLARCAFPRLSAPFHAFPRLSTRRVPRSNFRCADPSRSPVWFLHHFSLFLRLIFRLSSSFVALGDNDDHPHRHHSARQNKSRRWPLSARRHSRGQSIAARISMYVR